jgi:hypothetical protein
MTWEFPQRSWQTIGLARKRFLLKLKTVFNFRGAAYYTGDIVVNIPEKTRV